MTSTRRNFLKTVSTGALLSSALGLEAAPRSGVKRVGSTAQRLKEKPYEKRVCRVECYPSCLEPKESYVGLSVEEYVDLIHEAGLEVQIVAGEIDRGTPRFRSKMIPPLPEVDRDRLPKFLELAHERGILVLTYYPMNYTKPLKKIHPEWLMKFLDDGRPEPENLGWFCFNSPYRDWLPQYLIEYLDNLDLDGFYFDDMNWGSHEGWPYYSSCCCRYCEALFKTETGLNIPTKVDLDSLDFKHFLNWRYNKLRDLLAHITRKVREKNPDAILDFNYYGNANWNHPDQWSHGHPFNPLHLEDAGAYFFVETHEVREGSSFSAKLARAHGSPFAIWRHAMQVLPECGSSSAPYAEPLSPTIHGLTALANGGAAVYGMFDGPVPLHRDLMKSIFAEVKKRVDYMDGETVKHVALHFSQQTRDFRPSEDSKARSELRLKLTPTNRESSPSSQYFRVVKGAYEMLNRSHLLVDIVFDEQLSQKRLSPYKVLFLSDSSCLSDRQCDPIREFVSEGGTLIATHETSLFDDLGRKRDNFRLADVFGVDYRGPRAAGAVHGVVYVPHDQALRRQFGYVIAFAAKESEVSLRPGSKVEILCTRSSLTGDQPLNRFDLKSEYDSSWPAVVLHSFGKGKAIYISGDVGGGYLHNPYPPLKRFVATLVKRTAPPIEVEAPSAIEVTAATRGTKQLMVHLLNNPTPLIPFATPEEDVTTFFYLEEVNPIRDVRLIFNDFQVKKVTMPLQGIGLAVSGHPATVVVPEVKLHEVLILELGQN